MLCYLTKKQDMNYRYCLSRKRNKEQYLSFNKASESSLFTESERKKKARDLSISYQNI